MNNSTPRWVPKHSEDIIKLFESSKSLEYELRALSWKFSTHIDLNLINFYEFQQLIDDSRKCFALSEDFQENLSSQITSSASKKLQRSPYKVLLQKKAHVLAENLTRRHYQLIFAINKIIKSMLDFDHQTENLVDAAFLLCNLFNEAIEFTLKREKKSYGAQICSNTFPTLLLQQKKIDIGVILQILSRRRSEQCCLTLIASLLAACKLELTPVDAESDTSSVEILRTLTSHLTPPTEKEVYSRIHTRDNNDTDNVGFFDNLVNELSMKNQKLKKEDRLSIRDELLENVIFEEESFIANVLVKCYKLCPSSFVESTSSTPDFQKWINRGTRSLWTQIGGTLDHVILWWSEAPLACRPPIFAKQLRDWLLLIQPDEAPEPIFSTLRGLGETLTMHVTTTMWDSQFRLALVSSSLSCADGVNLKQSFSDLVLDVHGTPTGALWCDLLNTLTNLCNSCDQNGTIPNQLPIVEQIPILHRLDHSVHCMRLWALSKSKFFCSEWNMDMFFKIIHNDIGNCLDHLHYLRVPELVPADPLEVLIEVCVKLRAKLISEIKINISKLKITCSECIEILSSICQTYTLATLSLCFPPERVWQSNNENSAPGDYVAYFMKQIYLPILEATRDVEILSLTLKIICEAWLDHIYLKKVKFSKSGALNLLKDFDGVSKWITDCGAVSPAHLDKLAKHEVLRMCEGVGRILLRKPDEIVPILPSPRYMRPREDEEPAETAKLPPEMFVPNQKRWLELRARNRRTMKCLCACNNVIENE